MGRKRTNHLFAFRRNALWVATIAFIIRVPEERLVGRTDNVIGFPEERFVGKKPLLCETDKLFFRKPFVIETKALLLLSVF